MISATTAFDLVVVGAGIVGLAHAWAAAQRGLRVAVVERDARCVGASVRNFGFITVTGQAAGDTWQRAVRSRDAWVRLADEAGIRIQHRGLWVLARRPAAWRVLQDFAATPMGAACRLHGAKDLPALAPGLRSDGAAGALHSPHELRVESRDALPRLAHWLQERHGVVFHFGETVCEVQAPAVRTSRRVLHGDRVVLCTGADLSGPGSHVLARHRLRLCTLQMLRVQPPPGYVLPAAVMSDLSLVRYLGYATLPSAAVLHAQLQDEVPQSLAAGIHLIVVQSADGSLVVGDSHHDGEAPDPYARESVDRLILRHLHEAVDLPHVDITHRWTGAYPSGTPQPCVIEAIDDATRLVVVTSGTGASTAFAIAEDVLSDW